MSSELYFGNYAEDILRKHLLPGEHFIWAGQPRKGVIFRSSRKNMVLTWFGLIFCTVIGWLAYAQYSTGEYLFLVFWIPLFLIGFYTLIGRFFTDAMRRSRTAFAVTDQRIICKTGKLYSLPLSKVQSVKVDNESGEMGDVIFNYKIVEQFQNLSSQEILDMFIPPFNMIKNPRFVMDTVNRQKEWAKG